MACRVFLVVACGIQFLDQGLNCSPLHWEHGVLATGPPGKSWRCWLILGKPLRVGSWDVPLKYSLLGHGTLVQLVRCFWFSPHPDTWYYCTSCSLVLGEAMSHSPPRPLSSDSSQCFSSWLACLCRPGSVLIQSPVTFLTQWANTVKGVLTQTNPPSLVVLPHPVILLFFPFLLVRHLNIFPISIGEKKEILSCSIPVAESLCNMITVWPLQVLPLYVLLWGPGLWW